MIKTLDEKTARAYLKNRYDSINRTILPLIDRLKDEIKNTKLGLENVPPSLYPDFQDFIKKYKDVVEYLKQVVK